MALRDLWTRLRGSDPAQPGEPPDPPGRDNPPQPHAPPEAPPRPPEPPATPPPPVEDPAPDAPAETPPPFRDPPGEAPPVELPPPSQLPPAEAPPPQAEEPAAKGGWFSRLKAGLARSTAKLTDSVTGVFTKRKLDDAALEELEETLIAADLGVAASQRIVEGFRRTRFGKEVTDDEVKATLADEIAAILAPVAQPLVIDARPRAACRAGGRRQRHRQDDDDRQARQAVSRRGPEGGLRRRRHLPRRRRRAASGLGRPHRRPLLPACQGGRRCGRPRLRCADHGARPKGSTCCWSTPPAGCTTRPR